MDFLIFIFVKESKKIHKNIKNTKFSKNLKILNTK